jgi:17beta-estradiol 17-dehydrogenase / very-long-chain 3-oxoacyl-CoA reductase
LYPHILAKRLGHVIDLKKLGKWAVVTGSTDGIGKGYAKELAKRGLNVFLISRNEERLQATAEEIRKVALPNVEIKTLSIDFGKANADTYKTTITDALKDLEIGILVNNVGQSYLYPEEFLKVRGGSEEWLQNLLAVNCNSTMQMTRIVLPAMIAREKGAIINVASSMAMSPAPLLTVYSACKVFVDYFTRGIRSEYASSGVIFQGVYPFYVATKMTGALKRSFWVAVPDEFASGALDTVGVVDFTCGSFAHEILGIGFNLIPSFILTTGIRNALKTNRDKFLRWEQKQNKKDD